LFLQKKNKSPELMPGWHRRITNASREDENVDQRRSVQLHQIAAGYCVGYSRQGHREDGQRPGTGRPVQVAKEIEHQYLSAENAIKMLEWNTYYLRSGPGQDNSFVRTFLTPIIRDGGSK